MSNGLNKQIRPKLSFVKPANFGSGPKCDSCDEVQFQMATSKCGHKSCSSCLMKRYSDGYYSCAKCSLLFPTSFGTSYAKKQEDDDKYKCSSCDSTDFEQNLNLCITCKPVDCKSKNDLLKMVLCSTCALKQHVRKIHEVVDFFPYLSAYQFETDRKVIKTQHKQFSAAGELFQENVQKFLDVTKNVNKIYESSIDMLRRSTSSQNQVELAGKIEEFFKKAENINSLVNEKLNRTTESLKKQADSLQTAYSDNSKYNVNEKEIIKLSPLIVEGLEGPPKPKKFAFSGGFEN